MKILIIIDRLNWAYHSIAQSIVKYNTNKDLNIHIEHVKGNVDRIKKIWKKFDLIFIMGWQCYEKIKFIDLKISITGVHSYHSWDKGKSTPEITSTPPKNIIKLLNKFKRVNVVSKRLFSTFSSSGVEKVFYTPNGVDTELFTPKEINYNNDFVVGYSGSKAHDWRKGVTKFIQPAADKAGVKTYLAMLKDNKYVSFKNMPDFYKKLDCYICASSSEGFSLSVLEAAATGLPIISTRVSGCDELIKDGYDGFLVDRNIDSIYDKIIFLKKNVDKRKEISINISNKICKEYSWAIKVNNWIDFIDNRQH